MSTSITSSSNNRSRLLERYLPPIPAQFLSNWVKDQFLKGIFVLDPFGAEPELSIKAAQNGSRVIVAANNPILRLYTEVAANPPTPTQARTALSALAALRVRDERIELHIQSLYQTTCPNCERDIFAQAYLWEKDAKNPYARIIRCQYCNNTGEYPLTMSDMLLASKFKPGGLHHARALGRIAPPNDPDRIHVEEALNVYPPRAVYALLTLVNKLDQINIDNTSSKILMTILLWAFDQANTLWPHPVARERPRQLTVPPTYRENNIWFALEEAVDLWNPVDQPVPITYWPDLPPEDGGISLFEGRIKELVDQAHQLEFSAVITSFPRPNQAFWSLSALWAGWLWGYHAVEHFKPVLRRRRYDWAWHCTATHAAINSLKPLLVKNTSFKGLIGEAEPGFVTAVIFAAEQAGLQIENLEVYADKNIALMTWQASQKKEQANQEHQKHINPIRTAARNYLLARGEPSRYLSMLIEILVHLAQQGLFTPSESLSEGYNHIQHQIQETLNYRNGFIRFGGSEKSLDVGYWWLQDDSDASISLSDRVEIETVQYLLQHPDSTFLEIESAIKKGITGIYSGSLIPESSLILECLESYGEKSESGWKFKEQDTPSTRRAEINVMLKLIVDLGEKLGYRVQTEADDIPHSIWQDQNEKPGYVFYLSASAILAKYLDLKPTSKRKVILLPGGRANLVMFKLNRDPRLQKYFQESWRFLKFRHARQLANNPSLTLDTLESQLDLDPLTYSQTQLRMF